MTELQNQLDRDRVPSRSRPSVAKGRFLIVYGIVAGVVLIVLGASLRRPWTFSLLGIFIIVVCVAGGLTAINKARRLNLAGREKTH